MVSDGDERMIVWWWGGWFGDGNRCMTPMTTTLCVYRSLSLSRSLSLALIDFPLIFIDFQLIFIPILISGRGWLELRWWPDGI